MLLKKTLKAASAAALWMVPLLGANSAMATISLDGTAAAATANATAVVTFSLETIDEADNVAKAGQPKFYGVGVADGNPALSTTLSLGIYHLAVDENTNLYLRYDLNEHLMLRPAAAAGDYSVAIANDQGTASGSATLESSLATDPFLLIQVGEETAGTVTAGHVVTVDFKRLVATSGRGDGSVRVRGYTSALDAISGAANALFDRSATLLKVARSVNVKVDSGTATADVETGFTMFTTANPTRLGRFNIMINMNHLDEDGVALGTVAAETNADTRGAGETLLQDDTNTNLGDAMQPTLHDGLSQAVNDLFVRLGIDTKIGDTMTVAGSPVTLDNTTARGGHGKTTVSGSPGFAFGTPTFCNNPGGAGMGDPAAGTVVVKHPLAFAPADAETKAGPVTGGVAYLPWYLCFDVPATNTNVIAEGNYYLTMEFATPGDELLQRRPFPPMGPTDAMFGKIAHNGTTVHIPYVSTYEGYTQRLVITSRNKAPVEYTIMFHTEGDGTADPMMHTGMAGGEMTTVVKMEDITTLENPTRASATVNIVSHPSNVDVATTMVNKMDQSTDTVVLHRGRHDG